MEDINIDITINNEILEVAAVVIVRTECWKYSVTKGEGHHGWLTWRLTAVLILALPYQISQLHMSRVTLAHAYNS